MKKKWAAARLLDRAREPLEDTDWSIDRITLEVGFGSGTALRAQFRNRLSIAPSRLRGGPTPA